MMALRIVFPRGTMNSKTKASYSVPCFLLLVADEKTPTSACFCNTLRVFFVRRFLVMLNELMTQYTLASETKEVIK